jgi:mercuric reductase
MRTFDLVIIGGGTAGVAAAVKADSLGVRTALIEKSVIGGSGVNLGCCPTPAMLGEAAQVVEYPMLWGKAGQRVDFTTAMIRTRQVMDALRLQNYEWPLAALGNLTRIRGHAKFVGPNEVSIAGNKIKAARFVVATGSVPRVPAIAGLEDIDYLTDRDFLELTRPPTSIVILGASPLGLECAQILARFGTDVTVIQRGSQIMPSIEPEISEKVRTYLEADGIKIRIGESPQRVLWSGSLKELQTRSDLGEHRYQCEDIFLASGRTPRTRGIGLEEIGVEMDERGAVLVDDELVTSVPHIYAAGDASGGLMIENAARKEGAVAAENALLAAKSHIEYEAIPNCVFIDPQLAYVGQIEAEALRRRHDVESHEAEYSNLPQAIVAGDMRGLIKMTADKRTRRILGCAVIGDNAGNIIHEAALAMKYKLTVDDLAGLERVSPTYSEVTGMVAELFAKHQSDERGRGKIRESAA